MGLRGFLDLTMIVKNPYDYIFAYKIFGFKCKKQKPDVIKNPGKINLLLLLPLYFPKSFKTPQYSCKNHGQSSFKGGGKF